LSRLLEILGVLPAEGERIAWLLGLSLLNGLVISFFFSAANGLFLESFDAAAVPKGYIAAAVMGYLLVQIFSRLGRRGSFPRLVRIQLTLVLVLLAGLWLAATVPAEVPRWVRFLLFVSFGPLFTLLSLPFWGLTSRLFDIRQGKRLFALVGSGEVFTIFLGFMVVGALLARGVPLERLLPLATVVAVVLWLATAGVCRRYRDRLGPSRKAAPEPAADPSAESTQPRPFRGDLPALLRDPYFQGLAAMMVCAVLVYYLVDFNFLTQVKYNPDGTARDATGIAATLSLFFGGVRLVELVFRLFVSSRLVELVGILGSLWLLPASLLLLASFALFGSAGGPLDKYLFVVVGLSKAVYSVLAAALYEPTLRVLFQPLEEDHRLAVQTHVEGSAKQVATLLAGVGLLLYSLGEGRPDAVKLFMVVVPFLIGWVAVAGRLSKAYQRQLMDSLESRSDRGLAASPVEALKAHLKRTPPEALGDAVSLLARVDATAVVPMLEEMARERGDTVRRREALNLLGTIRADVAAATVGELANATAEEEPDGAIRRTALWARDRIDHMRQLASDPARIQALAASEDKGKRELAASAAGYAPDPAVRPILNALLGDREIRVRRAALVAAGRRGEVDLWPRLLRSLSEPAFANAATFGLILVGEPVLPDLERTFGKARGQAALRARILRIYQRIALSAGGEHSHRLLLDKLHLADRSLARRATVALSLSDYAARRPDEIALLHDRVEAGVEEIVWNLSVQRDLGLAPHTQGVREALETEVADGRERILLLLSLLYDRRALQAVQQSLRSGRPEAVTFALEVLEMVLSPQLKTLVMPVLEPLTPAQCLRRLVGRFHHPRQEVEERLSGILHRERRRLDLWPQARALEALVRGGKGDGETVRLELLCAFHHPAALLQEMACYYLLTVAPEEVARRGPRLPPERRERVARMLELQRQPPGALESHWRYETLFPRIAHLRRLVAFRDLPAVDLERLAGTARHLALAPGEPLGRSNRRDVDVLMEGRLEGAEATSGSLLTADSAGAVAAATESHLLRLDGEVLFEMMADYGEIVPAILKAGGERARHG
jgi:hypothetical protein